MNLILVNYSGPLSELFNLFPDNGLALLAAVLKERGHRVRILDFCTVSVMKRFMEHFYGGSAGVHGGFSKYELRKKMAFVEEEIAGDICREIDDMQADAVGFKLWEGAGTRGVFRMAEKIGKSRPGVALIAGGPQTEAFREEILLAAPHMDYLIYGDGERPLSGLLEALAGKRALKDVPALIYRDGEKILVNERGDFIGMEELPLPDYSVETYPAMEKEKIRIFLLEDSRGCPNRCSFCIHPGKSGNFHRLKGPEKLAADAARLSSSLRSRFFRLSGSNPPASLTASFAAAVEGKGYRYSAFGHTHSENDLLAMKRSGCTALAFGVESGSSRILSSVMGKRIDLRVAERTLSASRRAGIFTIASLILPTPRDTEETLEETFDFIRRTRPDSVTVQIPLLTPRTLWWRQASRYGFGFSDEEVLRRKLLYFDAGLFQKKLNPLPYDIGDFTFAEVLAMAAEFNGRFEALGVCRDISDFLVLCAEALGEHPASLRGRAERIFSRNDWQGLEELAVRINRSIEEDFLNSRQAL